MPMHAGGWFVDEVKDHSARLLTYLANVFHPELFSQNSSFEWVPILQSIKIYVK